MILFRDKIDETSSLKDAVANVKDSTGNAKINEKVINDLLSPDLVKYCGSNTSDHKNDSTKDSKGAFKQLFINLI